MGIISPFDVDNGVEVGAAVAGEAMGVDALPQASINTRPLREMNRNHWITTVAFKMAPHCRIAKKLRWQNATFVIRKVHFVGCYEPFTIGSNLFEK